MKRLLSLLPDPLHRIGFRFILAYLLRRNPGLKKRLREIDGKSFLLEATDIRKSYAFRVEGGSLRVTGADKRAPDVTMRGDIDSLLALFQRKVDADSLFFSRRLAIEGDVYASVFLKNLLESL